MAYRTSRSRGRGARTGRSRGRTSNRRVSRVAGRRRSARSGRSGQTIRLVIQQGPPANNGVMATEHGLMAPASAPRKARF